MCMNNISRMAMVKRCIHGMPLSIECTRCHCKEEMLDG